MNFESKIEFQMNSDDLLVKPQLCQIYVLQDQFFIVNDLRRQELPESQIEPKLLSREYFSNSQSGGGFD